MAEVYFDIEGGIHLCESSRDAENKRLLYGKTLDF